MADRVIIKTTEKDQKCPTQNEQKCSQLIVGPNLSSIVWSKNALFITL